MFRLKAYTMMLIGASTVPQVQPFSAYSLLSTSGVPRSSFSSSSSPPRRSHTAEHQTHHRPTRMQSRSTTTSCHAKKRRKRYAPCQDDNDDETITFSDLDRREAAFAMLGTLWSITTTTTALLNNPAPAQAAYGAEANLALPNMVEGITNRVNQQCLVESLGNRECLLYLDPAKKLYQGADSQVLLERFEKASAALADVPQLVEQKKWSAISGLLTGPMGSLGVTMEQLMKLAATSAEGSSGKLEAKAREVSKLVKSDVINIGMSADRKQGEKALEYAKAAEEHLALFLASL